LFKDDIFTVVSNEVRNLAEQTSNTAKEINTIINLLKDKTQLVHDTP
jgi:methyl-accepting chemotaxis protein